MSAARLASAPCTWGVWERTIDRGDLVPPRTMLETVCDLGYTGIELGPPGYFGTDPASVSSLLGEYGLSLVGAFATEGWLYALAATVLGVLAFCAFGGTAAASPGRAPCPRTT